jgi:hypothetical protein
MAKKSKKSSVVANRYKQQHGLHHQRGKHYMKVYWPYLPVFIFIGFGIVASILVLYFKPDLSGKTNDVSVAGLLSDTNQNRLASNEQPLTLHQQLESAAQTKANSMVSGNYWSHNTPTGETPWDFMISSGYKYQTAGENLAYGFSNNSAVLNAWMDSTPHRTNILNDSFSNIGFGVAHSSDYQGMGPQTIIVAMYAEPSGAIAAATTSTDNRSLSSSPAYTNISSVQPSSTTVSRVEAFNYSYANLSIFISGLAGGAAVAFLIIKHGLMVKRWALKGEALVVEHPLFDIALVVLVIGSSLLNQTVGFIR